jgi:FixJ family two-component response regulator
MTTLSRAYVIDDDDAMVRMLQRLLGSIQVDVLCFSNGPDFFAAYTPFPSQCLVTDMRLPGMSGLDIQQELRRRQIELPVIFITGHAEIGAAVEAMRHGAYDFVEKPFSAQAMLDKVDKALMLSRAQYAMGMQRKSLDARLALLTPKERAVAELVVSGQSSRQIGESLGISIKTVENHRSRILEKLHISSVVELVKLFV